MIVNMQCAWRNVLYLGLAGTTFFTNHTQDNMVWVFVLFCFSVSIIFSMKFYISLTLKRRHYIHCEQKKNKNKRHYQNSKSWWVCLYFNKKHTGFHNEDFPLKYHSILNKIVSESANGKKKYVNNTSDELN